MIMISMYVHAKKYTLKNTDVVSLGQPPTDLEEEKV